MRARATMDGSRVEIPKTRWILVRSRDELGVATNARAFALGLGSALSLLIIGVRLRAVWAWASRGGLDRS
jgi:hypothetical protein